MDTNHDQLTLKPNIQPQQNSIELSDLVTCEKLQIFQNVSQIF